MKATEIREKLNKAQETVTKKEGTLARYIKKEEKLRSQIEAKGWDVEAGRYQKMNTAEHDDCYWTFCDYEDILDGIKRTEKAIEEKKATVEKWQEKLEKALKEEKEADTLPEVLKTFEEEVIKEWNEWDRNRREYLRKEYKKMQEEDEDRLKRKAFKNFIKKYKYAGYEFMSATDEEINKENTKHARNLVMNLWKRVKDITGEVTNYEYLTVTCGNEWEGAVVNGWVEGENGKALVETIGAGGYNIQKFHYRTLVKKA